jgi:NAD(P)-dependent dehydrogenase (short-subunit alcohol dehydrogenase family)
MASRFGGAVLSRGLNASAGGRTEGLAMVQVEKKVAIVTGAGRGIGRAAAIALAHAGYALCLAARTQAELEGTRALCGLAPARSLIVTLDLADSDAPDNLFSTATDHFQRLDVLVNNAGWAPARTPLLKTSAADLDRMIAVNLRAPIALARLAAAFMAGQGDGGVIVNVASMAARQLAAGEAVYSAVKAGLVAFTHASFGEFRRRGIRTTVILPGFTDTALIPPNQRLDRSAMMRPDDVAAAIMSVVNAPASASPLEIVLEPSRDPMAR